MDPQFHTREEARAKLTAKIADQENIRDDPKRFSTYDPQAIIDDAEFRLRWIDCAPDEANHQTAILMDKDGVPLGGNYDENLGPCKGLREARASRGRHPLGGQAAKFSVIA